MDDSVKTELKVQYAEISDYINEKKRIMRQYDEKVKKYTYLKNLIFCDIVKAEKQKEYVKKLINEEGK